MKKLVLPAALLGALEPQRLLDCSPEALRGVGLSARKVEYLKGIAAATPALLERPWATMSDQEVLKALDVDIDNTIEAQKDMHFLRDLRKGTSSVKGKVINTVVGALALAGLYKLLSGIRWGA